MKVKYFNAENREAAESAAMGYFECEKEAIIFETVFEDEESGKCRYIGFVGTPAEISNMNGSFNLCYESDGVYLEIFAKRGLGKAIALNDIMYYLSRKNISGLDIATVEALFDEKCGMARIAHFQDEYIYGESLTILISDNEHTAEATLHAPEEGGQLLTEETVVKQIKEAGIVHGVDEEVLTNFIVSKNYETSCVIAKATLPVDGDDGKLLFNFSIDERTGSPKEIGGGRVDYKSLDLYVTVTEEQLLVTRVLATAGINGKSVTGRELIAKPGKDILLPKGKNVKINDEKTEMYALCSGMVEYVNNSVNVSSVYNISGDCDISVGNIDFDGSVHVSGTVRSGSTIKATGGIIVDGSVEAATIIAGGNVEIKGGVQGADKGFIEAGGAVSMLYVEHGVVRADGPITFDVSIHSIIEAGETLTAKGRRGAIIGGRAGAAGNIIANYIGTLSNTNTEVAVGVMPKKRTRLQFLTNEITALEGEQANLDKLDAYLAKTKDYMNPDKWELLNKSSIKNRSINAENLERYREERESLLYDLEHSTDGKIHVLDTVFSGSRLLIGSDAYMVNDEINYASFKNYNSNVVYVPCEISKAN